jgi:hypothetical protein
LLVGPGATAVENAGSIGLMAASDGKVTAKEKKGEFKNPLRG